MQYLEVNILEIFSARLKWLRDKKGYSQKEMADLLGVSQPYYFKFEKGTGQPNLETLKKLPGVLGESLDFMIGVTDFETESRRIFAELSDIVFRIERGRDELNFYLQNEMGQFKDVEELNIRITKLQSGIDVYTKRFLDKKLEYIRKIESIPLISEKTTDYIIEVQLSSNMNDLIKSKGPQ